MAVREALEATGGSGVDVEEATEAVSAYLTGDIEALPAAAGAGGAVEDIVTAAIQETRQKPAFAGLFA